MQLLYDPQPRPYRSLGVVFVGQRIAKVHQQPIAQILSDMPLIAMDDCGAGGLIVLQDSPPLLGIELCGEGGGAHHVTEHHRQLAALTGIPSRV